MGNRSILYTNIEDLVSPWDLIILGSIYSWKKCIEKSFTMVIKENNYVKQFPRYQQFSIVWKVFLRAFGGYLNHWNWLSISRVIVQIKFVILPFCLHVAPIILFILSKKYCYWTVAHMTAYRLFSVVYIEACIGRSILTQISH